jgi:hypothetical protein
MDRTLKPIPKSVFAIALVQRMFTKPNGEGYELRLKSPIEAARQALACLPWAAEEIDVHSDG